MTGRALLASPLGFLIGVSLGALGGGGSILAVPVLVFVAGQTPAEATTTSLLVVGAASVVGAAGHWRHGRVRVGAGLWFGLLGVAGSLAGSALNRRLDGDVLLLAFAGLIIVAAWRIVAGCPSCTRAGEMTALRTQPTYGVGGGVVVRSRPDTARIAKLAAAGTFVGFLTGLFGVGGGFVIVPALRAGSGLSMHSCIATSLMAIALISAIAVAGAVFQGVTIEWMAALPFVLGALAGMLAGRRLAPRIAGPRLQQGFAIVMLVVAAGLVVHAVGIL